MSPATAVKQEVIDPRIYVKAFYAYAVSQNIEVSEDNIAATTAAFKQWDSAINGGKMRQAIIAKYGTEALLEQAIDAKFRQYLYNAFRLVIKAHPKNPSPFKAGPSTTVGVRNKSFPLQLTGAQRDNRVESLTAHLNRIVRQLKFMNLSLSKINSLAAAAYEETALAF